MTAKTNTWQRVGRSGKYAPGKDSPENHYINHHVIGLLLQFMETLRPVDEQHKELLNNLFVAGLQWGDTENLTRGVPRKLAAALVATRVKISAAYEKAWNRVPYAEEYEAIVQQVGKWR